MSALRMCGQGEDRVVCREPGARGARELEEEVTNEKGWCDHLGQNHNEDEN